MDIPSQPKAIHEVAERLAEWVDADCQAFPVGASRRDSQIDAVLRAGSFVFAVAWKSVGSAASVGNLVRKVRDDTEKIKQTEYPEGRVVPLIAVPFMGRVGRGRCAEHGVAWLDLSGNARVIAPGIRILMDGRPNRYRQRGRPSTAFAPMGSRITRWLLMHPNRSFTQRELARATGADEGYTSRVAAKLEQDGLIIRNDAGAVRPRDPDLLLDAWREVYDFTKHHVVQGHVAARSGDALLRQVSDGLNRASVFHAATGLAAAWILGRFAGFRTASIYLPEEPSSDLLEALSFREDARGANLWLVVPNDEGVFQGVSVRNGVHCVHPVQVYLDLHAHPERARDVARELRGDRLRWRTGD